MWKHCPTVAKWYKSILKTVDDALISFSKTAKKIVRMIRLARALLFLFVLTILGLGVAGIIWPQHLPYFFAAATIPIALPVIILAVLVALPLRAKSVVRLIDMGYPANAKEMAIRMAARKLHEESIESEELLFATAWNESKKVLRKYRQRAKEEEE